MIVVTGAAGFIGSCLVKKLNIEGLGPVLAVDDFSAIEKNKNLEEKDIYKQVDRFEFIQNPGQWGKPEFIFHIGARTDTTEFDKNLLYKLNTGYTTQLWNYCTENKVPLIYASSAATYGLGENGFADDHKLLSKLKPLNPYGQSKHDFDIWAVEQTETPPFWAGLKFFNVFGPNEYHKGRMASVVMHGSTQIRKNGFIKLFRSHLPEYKDGEQVRDFVYVKDVLDVMLYLYKIKPESAIYNLGTGHARNWNDLATAIFKALNKPVNIEYIDIPEDIREKYQYYTEAKMRKLINTGYDKPFTSLEAAVDDYINSYLVMGSYY
ncbi:MAG: ADP-glyceromanno-heptose 6-epimerase [Bacteroidia bacterium]